MVFKKSGSSLSGPTTKKTTFFCGFPRGISPPRSILFAQWPSEGILVTFLSFGNKKVVKDYLSGPLSDPGFSGGTFFAAFLD